MQIHGFLPGACLSAALAVASLVCGNVAYAQSVVLPAGATIMPNPAPGSVFHHAASRFCTTVPSSELT